MMNARKYIAVVVIFYAALYALFSVHGCVTTGYAQEIAAQRDAAIQGVNKRDEQIGTLKDAIKQGADETTAAILAISGEMDAVQVELAEQVANAEPGSERWKEGVIAFLAKMNDERNDFVVAVQEANIGLQKAEDGWDVAESLLGLAGGFFPPAAIGALFIRRGRNVIRGLNGEVAEHVVRGRELGAEVEHQLANFHGVVAAMAAGGGPVKKEEARAAMAAVPGLKDLVTARRVVIGDKVMEAVTPAT